MKYLTGDQVPSIHVKAISLPQHWDRRDRQIRWLRFDAYLPRHISESWGQGRLSPKIKCRVTKDSVTSASVLVLTHAHAHTNSCVYHIQETAGVMLNEPVAEPGIMWFCGHPRAGKQRKQVLS